MNSTATGSSTSAAAANGAVSANDAGQPFYDRARASLKELLIKKRNLERVLAIQEETIYKKETEYLEETPAGNIITGFDAYTKASGNSGALGRRKGNVVEGNRVFSRSSVSFGAGNDQESPAASSSSTPMQTSAPTPAGSSYLKGVTDGVATPPSASSTSRTGAGKKNKKGAVGGDDSEGDAREPKKARTGSMAARK